MTVSWIAIGLSAIALAISVYVMIRDRPRVGVLTRNDVNVGGEPNYIWYITVVNYGRHPQTISDVGLDGKDLSYRTSVYELRKRGIHIDGPKLPEIVKPYSFAEWIVPHNIMRHTFPKPNQEFRSYVAKYSPVFRNWRRVMGVVNKHDYRYLKMPGG